MCKNENQLEAQKVYDLKLHKSITVGTGRIEYEVVRVIGGWIYNHMRLDSGQMNSVFVPFDNEFMLK